jgi:hypothetical protein
MILLSDKIVIVRLGGNCKVGVIYDLIEICIYAANSFLGLFFTQVFISRPVSSQ